MRCGEPEPLEPGARQHDGVELRLVELAQARVDVAAQRHDVRSGRAERKLQSRAAGSRCRRARLPGSSASLAPELAHEHVASVLAARNASDREPGGELGGHVLERVDREVGLPRSSASSISFGEEALASHLGERTSVILSPVVTT